MSVWVEIRGLYSANDMCGLSCAHISVHKYVCVLPANVSAVPGCACQAIRSGGHLLYLRSLCKQDSLLQLSRIGP